METERPDHGDRPAAPERRARETGSPHLPLQGDIFVSNPDAPRASRMLWEIVEEEMHVRRLTLAAVCCGSGVARQTLNRYRDRMSRFIAEPVLQRLVDYFASLPPEESDPTLVVRWRSTGDIRARIADRMANPEEAAILHALILEQGDARRADAEAADDSAR